MKYLDEYRNGQVVGKIVAEIRRVTTRPWTLMEVCGGQTHSIVKHGVDRLLRRIDHEHAIARGHESRIAAPEIDLGENMLADPAHRAPA